MIRTISLDDGKYEFDVDDNGQGKLMGVRRNKEHWEAAMQEFPYSKVVVSMLWRIAQLEDQVKVAPEPARFSNVEQYARKDAPARKEHLLQSFESMEESLGTELSLCESWKINGHNVTVTRMSDKKGGGYGHWEIDGFPHIGTFSELADKVLV